MKKNHFFSIFAGILMVLFAVPAEAQETLVQDTTLPIQEGVILLAFEDDVDPLEMANIYDLSVMGQLEDTRLYKIRVPVGEEAWFIEAMKQDPNVLYAEFYYALERIEDVERQGREEGRADNSQTDRMVLNAEPDADFHVYCEALSCVFTSDSQDRDGQVVDWHWTLGDGSTASGQKVRHQYETAGNYTAALQIQDDRGAEGWARKSFNLSGPAGTSKPMLSSVHVGDIDGFLSTDPENDERMISVVVNVHGPAHEPVSGITVTGEWGGAFNGPVSKMTDETGQVQFELNSVPENANLWFTVENLEGSYSRDMNHDPDGDSDGNTIVLQG